MTIAKAKVSISISTELLEQVDEAVAADPSASRSSVIERWVRRAMSAEAANALREETIRYYDTRTAEAREEDGALGRAASRAARSVEYD